MANRFARKAGNFNDTDVWSDTPTGTAGAEFIPVAGDTAYSNSFIITINTDITTGTLRNDINGTGATIGGYFSVVDGGAEIDINANITTATSFNAIPSGIGALTTNNNSTIVNITGNISITSNYDYHTLKVNGFGVVNVNGTWGAGTTSYAPIAIGEFNSKVNLNGNEVSTGSGKLIDIKANCEITINGTFTSASNLLPTILVNNYTKLTINSAIPDKSYNSANIFLDIARGSEVILNNAIGSKTYFDTAHGYPYIRNDGNLIINSSIANGNECERIFNTNYCEINGDISYTTYSPIVTKGGKLIINGSINTTDYPAIINLNNQVYGDVLIEGPITISTNKIFPIQGPFKWLNDLSDDSYMELYVGDVKKKFRPKKKYVEAIRTALPENKVLKGVKYGIHGELEGTKEVLTPNLTNKLLDSIELGDFGAIYGQ